MCFLSPDQEEIAVSRLTLSNHFDEFSRVLARPMPRRDLVKNLARLAAGVVAGSFLAGRASAAACPSGFVTCGTQCCPPGYFCASGNLCCQVGQYVCGPVCCAFHYICKNGACVVNASDPPKPRPPHERPHPGR